MRKCCKTLTEEGHSDSRVPFEHGSDKLITQISRLQTEAAYSGFAATTKFCLQGLPGSQERGGGFWKDR